MNAKCFGKQNLEIQAGSGKNSLFPLIRLHSGSSACEDTDPGLSPETRSPHHSSTPHLKHTIVFSVTLWSLLLHSLIFTTYSTGCFTGKQLVRLHQLSAVHFLSMRTKFYRSRHPRCSSEALLSLISEWQPDLQLQKLPTRRASALLCFAWTSQQNNRERSKTLVNKITFCKQASFAWLDFLKLV